MLISHVIPAFNASSTITRTLDSVFTCSLPFDWQVEAIVVDDGSTDGAELAEKVSRYPRTRMVVHECNRGMCAARNSGIAASAGDIVTILDADDELIHDWPLVLESIVSEWPDHSNVCYAACRNPEGVVTAQEPEYCGFLTLSDLLNERHSGEYIPLFRGDYVRSKPYVDLGTRKSCGIISYINYAIEAPFWVTNRVFRIYHEVRAGSVTHNWASPKKAEETAKCYLKLFELYGDLYQREAPRTYLTKLLRLAVYLRLAGLPTFWQAWKRGASIKCPIESIATAIILVLGPRVGSVIVKGAKQFGLVRQYG